MMSKLSSLTISAVFAAGVVLVLAAERGAGPKREPVIKQRPTHEQLAKRQSPRSTQKREEVRRDEVLKLPHRIEQQGEGLISRSSIISSEFNWTLVPNNAILHIPPLFEKRVNNAREGKLTTWREFYGKNRGWIRELPVTIKQAKGEDPLSQEYLESIKKAGQVVVAVCRGGPISVNLPAEEPTPDEAAMTADEPSDSESGLGESEGATASQESPEEKAAREERVLQYLIKRLRQRSN